MMMMIMMMMMTIMIMYDDCGSTAVKTINYRVELLCIIPRIYSIHDDESRIADLSLFYFMVFLFDFVFFCIILFYFTQLQFFSYYFSIPQSFIIYLTKISNCFLKIDLNL